LPTCGILVGIRKKPPAPKPGVGHSVQKSRDACPVSLGSTGSTRARAPGLTQNIGRLSEREQLSMLRIALDRFVLIFHQTPR
jgi:hypothetical protein